RSVASASVFESRRAGVDAIISRHLCPARRGVPEDAGMHKRRITILVAALAAAALCCPAAAVAADPVIAAAGDIACDPTDGSYNGGLGTATQCRQQYTSDVLVGAGLAAALPLGDNQYENATLVQYQTVFDPTWGRVSSI